MFTLSTTSVIQTKKHDIVSLPSIWEFYSQQSKWIFHITGNKIMNNIQNVFPVQISPIQCLKLILVSKGTHIPL